LKWKGGNIHQVARDLLANAPAWLMISENLKQVLMQRYQLNEKPCLIVHNPAPPVDSRLPIGIGMTPDSYRDDLAVTGDNDVNEPHRQPSTLPAGRQESTVNSQLIIYAGSIWPMHADALVAVAKAIHLLHQQGHTQFSLRLYVPAAHWKQYQFQLQGPGVEYAGWVPYAQLQEVLQPAWLTLCTASFLPAHHAFSFSSVQTKLTDYMAAGKPIWFVGPGDAACGQFVRQNDCGYVSNDARVANIAQQLGEILADREGYWQKANTALQKATGEFSQPAVQQRLSSFLEQHSSPQPQSQS
jgi:glycosyltransferase involved in cell wall biosynthesis